MQLVSQILILWIVIYPVDSAIQRLNNRGLINIGETNPVDIEIYMYMYPVYSAPFWATKARYICPRLTNTEGRRERQYTYLWNQFVYIVFSGSVSTNFDRDCSLRLQSCTYCYNESSVPYIVKKRSASASLVYSDVLYIKIKKTQIWSLDKTI